MTVNVAATFKKDERINNGLERIARDLVKDPLNRHLVVGIIECTRITRDIADGGVETPTVRFALIEVLEGEPAEQARQLLDAAHNVRTGRSPQPALFGDTERDVVDATVWCGATDDQGRECALAEHDDDTEHEWRDPTAGRGYVDPVAFMHEGDQQPEGDQPSEGADEPTDDAKATDE